MMKFRNFILAASLCVASLWPSTACIDYEDPTHYNLFFCTPEMPDIDAKRLDETTQFWAKYLGVQPDNDLRLAVNFIYEYQFEEDNEDNLFLTMLRKQGKTDALQLVRLNFDLQELNETAHSWDYKKVTPAHYNALLNKIDALKLSGDLSRRKTFLKLRCLFALKDYDACMRLWNMYASKWEESPLRQRAYGYIAGIYFRKGEFEKAMQIYFEQGDLGSIHKCVNRILQSTTLQQQYEKDPNAPILAHFLEDYANYFYHSTFDEFWRDDEKNNPIWSAVNRQRSQVLALAERAIKEGKTHDPQMWQAFIGFVQLANKEDSQAYESLVKAEKMKPGIMADRIGFYKLAASLKAQSRPADYDNYLAQSLDQLLTRVYDVYDESRTHAIAYSLFSYEIQERLNEYLSNNKPAYLQLLAHMTYSEYNRKIYRHDHEYKSADVRQLLSLLEDGTDDVLAKTFIKHSGVTAEQVNEYLGTLLMREGNYEEAANYLAKVSIDYIKDMGIAPYLYTRKASSQIFTREKYGECEGLQFVAKGNPKLDFCRQVIDMQLRLANTEKDEKAQVAIALANHLFQGSVAGDRWAISEYSWSSYGMNSNELDLQAIPYLHEAIASTQHYDLLTQAYFGLAAVPTVAEDGIHTIASTGIFDKNADPELLEARKTNIEGYRWLIKQKNRTNRLYSTCDWLKLYQPGSLN